MTRHLGLQVNAYVDQRLDASALRAFDQHLVVCLVCRHAAEEERRLLASLRSGPTPGFSADLQSMLLALAEPALPTVASSPPTSPLRSVSPFAARGDRSAPPLSPIPRAPESVRQLRVPTVPPASPALHRSPRRAAMVAGLAAGASAAAAFGLAVAGPGTGAAATIRSVDTRPGVSSVSVVPAAFTGSGLGASPLRQALGRPGR
ncbi:MAG: hypothetical protein ABJA89_03420 [Lapillicoccus sp.]